MAINSGVRIEIVAYQLISGFQWKTRPLYFKERLPSLAKQSDEKKITVFSVRWSQKINIRSAVAFEYDHQRPNMTTKAASQSAVAHLAFCQQHQGEMLSLLRHMVEIESPSDDKAAVDRMGAFLGQVFERLGGKVTFYPQQQAGNHLKAEFPAELPAELLASLRCFLDISTPSGKWGRWPKCPSALRMDALLARASMT